MGLVFNKVQTNENLVCVPNNLLYLQKVLKRYALTTKACRALVIDTVLAMTLFWRYHKKMTNTYSQLG